MSDKYCLSHMLCMQNAVLAKCCLAKSSVSQMPCWPSASVKFCIYKIFYWTQFVSRIRLWSNVGSDKCCISQMFFSINSALVKYNGHTFYLPNIPSAKCLISQMLCKLNAVSDNYFLSKMLCCPSPVLAKCILQILYLPSIV